MDQERLWRKWVLRAFWALISWGLISSGGLSLLEAGADLVFLLFISGALIWTLVYFRVLEGWVLKVPLSRAVAAILHKAQFGAYPMLVLGIGFSLIPPLFPGLDFMGTNLVMLALRVISAGMVLLLMGFVFVIMRWQRTLKATASADSGSGEREGVNHG